MRGGKVDSRAVIFALGLVALPWLGTAGSNAQHGTAGNGYYPSGHEGDTWSGSVTSTDDATRTVTLAYSGKKKAETFIGVLKEGCCKVKMSDGTVQELRPSQLSPGRQIVVYYIPRTTKVQGKKITFNEIFKVDFVK